MTQFQQVTLFLSRVVMGWMMFYAGITKVLDPAWSAEFYLKSAKVFPVFYQALASPGILPFVNLINAWGLTLLGVSLILGAGVRLSSVLGALLMLLYYFPILDFPYPNPHAYIVDEHIIYIFVLLFFGAIEAGKVWGIDSFLQKGVLD